MDFFTNKCNSKPKERFWERFSETFAQAARGSALFLGNGERCKVGAYNKESYFATREIPSMSTKKVTRVVALIVHQKGKLS